MKYHYLSLVQSSKGEWHIVKSNTLQVGNQPISENNNTCNPSNLSGNIFTYSGQNVFNENDMRNICADLQNNGKEICGNCVRKLYKTYNNLAEILKNK